MEFNIDYILAGYSSHVANSGTKKKNSASFMTAASAM